MLKVQHLFKKSTRDRMLEALWDNSTAALCKEFEVQIEEWALFEKNQEPS